MSSNQPIVFLSYSHKDEALKERLETHLKAMRGRLDVWDDRRLRAGEDWKQGLSKAIASAHAAVLLVSADFLASDFIQAEEVPRLLKRRAKDGVPVIPMLLSPCLWREIEWLAAMQIRPTDARPVTVLEDNDREQAFADIASEVLDLATKQRQAVATPPRPRYEDGPSQELSEALEAAYQRLETLVSTDSDTNAQRETILDLKRRLRKEGQLKPGDVLSEGRYKLLEILGRGGFSTVFKAYDRKRRELVAVKVLHPQYARDKTRRDRFFRGARKMGELRHPAVVGVIDPEGQDEGYFYFVMEYVDGDDLRNAVMSGKIGGVEGLSLLAEVAEALYLAHRQGMIHRDVKPANILLAQDGKAKLTDFDLVRAFDTTAGTRTGSMLGTFLYMAPEAMMGAENATLAADVYSLAMCATFVLHRAEIPATFMRNPDEFFDALVAPEGVKQVLRLATAWKASFRPATTVQLWHELRKETDPQSAASSGEGSTGLQLENLLIWANERGEDAFGEWASFKVNGVTQRMRWIPPGMFKMGSPPNEVGRGNVEGPVHHVTLTQGFWLADTPCTQALWQAVMEENPSEFKAPQRPVEMVSWADCNLFLRRLDSLVPGLALRFPTEAEWEYACRAGTTTATWLGNLGGQIKAPILDRIAWYRGNSGGETHKVGQKEANPWGLYDVLGNVDEWCLDGQQSYSKDFIDPVGSQSTNRCIRGGSWNAHANYVRAAFRYVYPLNERLSDLGFRLARGPLGGTE